MMKEDFLHMKNEQERAPLFETVKAYKDKKPAYFCIPGHRRERGISREWVEDAGSEIFAYDLTEAHGLDDLHAPEGAILEAEKLTANLYHVEQSRFLVNGTTCGNEAMLLSCLSEGDEVLVPRNAHKSILMGLVLSGARPVWMMPEYIKDLSMYGCVTAETVEKKLNEHKNIRAVVLVSPNYYGFVSDIKAIAGLCHKRNIPLLVDEAHGGHLYFSEAMPKGAMAMGADMCVQSWHKVCGALGQSSVIHVHSERIDMARVEDALKMVQTTSPSYLLMTSMDLARRELALYGREQLTALSARAHELRVRLNHIPGIYCPGPEIVHTSGIFGLDESRITIHVSGCGMGAKEFSDRLFDTHGVDLELAEGENALAILTPGNTKEDLERLFAAVAEEAEKAVKENTGPAGPNGKRERDPSGVFKTLPPMKLTPRAAWFSKKRSISIKESVGEVIAEAVIPYPPGIPIIYPGEEITEEIYDALCLLKREEHHMHGIADTSLETIRVIKKTDIMTDGGDK